jgi:ATP-dependent Clp protease ATP-binding subunit ClpA
MFERFTDESRRVVVYAQEESRARADGYIGSAHLLLGLLAVPDTTAHRLLDRLGVESPRLRARLRALPRTTTILGPAARGAASGPAEPVVETGRLVAALLREFPESPMSTWVGT